MLRRRLQELTEINDVSQHADLLAALGQQHPNSIKIVDSTNPLERYTCLMHVLGFDGVPEYESIASRGFNVVYAGSRFAHWLIDNGLLEEIPVSKADQGDLIFYFDTGGRFKHAGVIASNSRVVSKWGTGNLYEHGLYEVPDNYGDDVRCFKKMEYEKSLEHFVNFAKHHGMPL
jgi:hypothetical protein